MGGRGKCRVKQSRRAVGRYRKWGGARAWRHFHLDDLVRTCQGHVAGGGATKRRQPCHNHQTNDLGL